SAYGAFRRSTGEPPRSATGAGSGRREAVLSSPSVRLSSVDMVAARQTAGGDKDHQEERCRGEADHDGRENQRLRHRISIVRQVAPTLHAVQHRGRADAQAAHAEDEEVHGIGKQRQPDDELVGAWTQDQPDARSRENADGDRERQFHCWRSSSWRSTSRRATRSRRIDWWAMAMSISTVAPTTRLNTPRSKRVALAVGTLPTRGSSTYRKYEV